jgi:large subunit ribosomal protein L32
MQGHRRSHHALKRPTLVSCSNCGALIRPHHACRQCGHYLGKAVIEAESI